MARISKLSREDADSALTTHWKNPYFDPDHASSLRDHARSVATSIVQGEAEGDIAMQRQAAEVVMTRLLKMWDLRKTDVVSGKLEWLAHFVTALPHLTRNIPGHPQLA